MCYHKQQQNNANITYLHKIILKETRQQLYQISKITFIY